ncbi:MAG: YHYH protein [Verrucomicrobiota bacterium]
MKSTNHPEGLKYRYLLATAITGLGLLFPGDTSAHEWHRHSSSRESAPLIIPASEGSEPENSAAAATRAEAFAPFHPRVLVRWDQTWFSIESTGIAEHEMMTGITNWQQQIPVPQPYFGDNAWRIPLNPEPASNPTPVSTNNLLKGAYAIAVNGIPIFNLHNNRGENTLDIGELDTWGGHCGRADDYHYHIIPYHLAEKLGDSAVFAYALDGYPVYGEMEADGTARELALDSNQGHDHGETGYHYHALASADYSLRGLYGRVSVSGNGPENQVDPQPRTSELRPALTPLRNASITSFARPAENSFSLTYLLNGQDHVVNWTMNTDNRSVTYQFVNPTGTTTQTYNGWQAFPATAAPTLKVSQDISRLLHFEATGTANASHPFSWSEDLRTWQRFGFLQFGPTGSATFTLQGNDVRGFLRIDPSPGSGGTDPSPEENTEVSITQGAALTVTPNLYSQGQRIAGVGTIMGTDGRTWTVPADHLYEQSHFAPDLYNPQNGVSPGSLDQVDLDSVPIVEIDPDGELITGYIFADNYFELFVNGELVGVDPIPFTPFNSNVVRFRAKAPITYAFRLVDWEENLGLGTEENRGNRYHPGDAGLIASFSDGTVTNGEWKAQAYYMAPIDDPANVRILEDGTRDSSAANQTTGSDSSYGLHWKVPDDWASPDFDDASWPAATLFSNQTVGVDNKPSYTNFDDQFAGAGARFIWSSNLVLDNEVLVRFTRE